MPSPCVKKCWPNLGRRFLRFPKERDRRLKWIAILEVPELLSLNSKQIDRKRICDAHFRAEDLIPAYYPGSNNRALVRGALPIGKSLDLAAEQKELLPLNFVPENIWQLADTDNERDSSVSMKEDNLEINNKVVATNKVTEDERCNSLPMVKDNLIMDNKNLENQEYENYFLMTTEDNSVIETNRADKDNNESFLNCEDLELNARIDLDNQSVEDKVFLFCISHALNTMCRNDKLELKMRVLEVIKDLKGKFS